LAKSSLSFLKKTQLLCEVCRSREGVEVSAKYRRNGEAWDAWKEARRLVMCRVCISNFAFRGHATVNGLFIDSILEKEAVAK